MAKRHMAHLAAKCFRVVPFGMTSTYSKPSRWLSHKRIQPRPLLPLSPAPLPNDLPVFPSPLREPIFPGYTLTTHIIPAAFPRTTPDVPLPDPVGDQLGKKERRLWVEKTLNAFREKNEELMKMDEVVEGSKKVLWCCVNLYVRKDLSTATNGNAKGITLFFSQANGFPKEIWEPTLRHLLSSSPAASCVIDEIWSLESIQHGDAALLNSQNLPGIYDWTDHARDILNFLLHYIPSTRSSSRIDLPTHLQPIAATETTARKVRGFADRRLVAIGHSFGGCALTQAALTYPALFDSLILIDPVILMRPHDFRDAERLYDLARGALQRRERWSSFEEAKASFATSPFFSTWDPEVLSIYLSCGLTPSSSPTGVRLKTPGVQEALVFVHYRTTCEVWQALEGLDERVELRWVVPGKGEDPGMLGKQQTIERVWRRPVNSSNVVIKSAGHLIPQESPRELAFEIGKFLETKYVVGISSGCHAKL